MAEPRVFIDGHQGTTGLRIREWLAGRSDLVLVDIDPAHRKDPSARRDRLNEADAVVLCLPDDAAREAVAMIERPAVKVIDASTAHRVADDWTFGLAELSPDQRTALRMATRISNPGCYPITVILGLRPLVEEGLLPADAAISVHALSGYTGGGKSLIEKWEDPVRNLRSLVFEAPYALDRVHKHVAEMTRYAGLQHAVQFVPAVGPFATGMRVEVPLHAARLASGSTPQSVWSVLAERYANEPFVQVAPFGAVVGADDRDFDPCTCNGTNRIVLHVVGNPAGHVLLVGLLDNLGKGAAGSAIQNLNLALDLGETAGLPR